MKKIFLAIMLAFAGAATICAQTADTFEMKIWDGTDNTDKDRDDAVLYGYLPKNPNGKAVIICPGGGYRSLSMGYEGSDFARWFNEHGIAGFVLKYRLPGGRCEIPLADAERAMNIVRENARKWNVDPIAVGIMGSSAGGHLAATLATHYSDEAGRPDFQILLYPVITMNANYTHIGSRNNLIGETPSTQSVLRFSCEKQVTAGTPQAFVVVSAGDTTVPVYNSLQYAQSLINKKVPVSLHVYPQGRHGFGESTDFEDYAIWHSELLNWMETEVKGDPHWKSEPTKVKSITAAGSDTADTTFDLTGRKHAASTSPRGVYVKGGRKTIQQNHK